MKFKLDRDSGERKITISDSYGDELIVDCGSEDFKFKGLWFSTISHDSGAGCAVKVTRGKALKLAYAIIAELDPEAASAY